jgi:hypothetical protein
MFERSEHRCSVEIAGRVAVAVNPRSSLASAASAFVALPCVLVLEDRSRSRRQSIVINPDGETDAVYGPWLAVRHAVGAMLCVNLIGP